jgi:A/G-specific adenine glycosylase
MIEHEHAGEFPTDEPAVRRLPGVGRYTAAAILSITRDERLPILEGNTQRLYARLMALRGATDDVATQSRLWSFAESILPRKHCGAFNQALMELGATICTPRSPRCDVCPVSMLCAANRRGLADRIPPPRRRPAVEQVNEALVVVRRRGKILLVRYHENGRWGRLWDFLRFPVNGSTGDAAIREIERQITAQTGLVVDRCAAVMTINHTVTRFRITLACYETDADRGRPKAKKFAEARWIAAAELSTFPLNKTARRLSNQIREKS